MKEQRKHHWPDKQCYYCGKTATCYCDSVNSYPSKDGRLIDTDNIDKTEFCDRPLCDEHGEQIGISTETGKLDTIDICPKHVTMKKMNAKPELVTPNK